MSDTMALNDLRERVAEVSVAMVASIDEHGRLSSRPLTVQRIDENGDIYFVVSRSADWVIGGQAINVALVDDGRTWVSVSGTAEYVTGTSLLSDLWDEVTATNFGGDRADAVAMQVHAARWEYWTAPNRVARVVEVAKAFAMDRAPDFGDRGMIET